MNIATAATTELAPEAIFALYESLIDQLPQAPDFVVLFCSVEYDMERILTGLRKRSPGVALHGGTSCKGVMSQLGIARGANGGLAMFAISDPDGSYGVGAARCTMQTKEAAKSAILQALNNAECPGEVPSLVWITAVPGYEEEILEGIAEVIGTDVPIAGGSSADNTLDGSWKQCTLDTVYSDAVVVTALFPSTEVMCAFHSGYEPTQHKGVVTKTRGYPATDIKGISKAANQRTLLEIDNQPAAEVYNRWTDNLIADKLEKGGHVFDRTSLHPLGRVVGHIGNVPYFQLSHPYSVTADKGVPLFSDMVTGDTIVLMRGTKESIVSRPGRVALSALDTFMATPNEVAGALIVYCAGCMLTAEDRLDDVVKSIRGALPGTPFLGAFTYGEQGCFLKGGNKHGNLMISVVLFSK